jgi:hypothetical protein
MARVIFSPTAEPMLPAMKANSRIARLTGWPPTVAVPVSTASSIPLLFLAALSRSTYGF